MSDLIDITKAIVNFRDEYDWGQFHQPKDLALAINIESSELLEKFLWKTDDEANVDKVKEELADVFVYTSWSLSTL